MREEIIESFKHWMIEKATGSDECFAEFIIATWVVEIRVLMVPYKRILENKTNASRLVSQYCNFNFIRKVDTVYCYIYMGVKL